MIYNHVFSMFSLSPVLLWKLKSNCRAVYVLSLFFSLLFNVFSYVALAWYSTLRRHFFRIIDGGGVIA